MRRLTLHLNEVSAVADPWATRIAGPVAIIAANTSLEATRLAGSPLRLEARAEKDLRSVTITGVIDAEASVPAPLTVIVNGEVRSCSFMPARPFRWVLPSQTQRNRSISLEIAVQPDPSSSGGNDGEDRTSRLHLKQVSFDPDIPLTSEADGIVLSTVLLSYNRADLLQLTIGSYLETVSVPYELIIVDNASDMETRRVIDEFSQREAKIWPILLSENGGGRSLNLGVAESRGSYIHISENGLEYLPGWDRTLLTKLELFPGLGQLGLQQPDPRSRSMKRWTVDGLTVYLSKGNVMTPSVMPRGVYESGVLWTTRGVDPVLFPDDGRFSDSVKEHDYLVAWNDIDLVINHGSMVEEYVRRLPYYVANFLAKAPGEEGIEVLASKLRAGGYSLHQNKNGEWTTSPLSGEHG
jgi:hypothetical protein